MESKENEKEDAQKLGSFPVICVSLGENFYASDFLRVSHLQ